LRVLLDRPRWSRQRGSQRSRPWYQRYRRLHYRYRFRPAKPRRPGPTTVGCETAAFLRRIHCHHRRHRREPTWVGRSEFNLHCGKKIVTKSRVSLPNEEEAFGGGRRVRAKDPCKVPRRFRVEGSFIRSTVGSIVGHVAPLSCRVNDEAFACDRCPRCWRGDVGSYGVHHPHECRIFERKVRTNSPLLTLLSCHR
jgi:hypothetical protein